MTALKTEDDMKQQTRTKLRPKCTLGPVSDLERHLPADWWRTLFNAVYLKTDGDVVENDVNTRREIDFLLTAGLQVEHDVLDLCCGQGRHSLELVRRGFSSVHGIDRSRYLIRLARKRAKDEGLSGVKFSEGDARQIRLPENSRDWVMMMGNSFGYFEREEDDLKVLDGIKRILKSDGHLMLDIVDGDWMKNNYEARSWEWLDEQHFVNRERSLSADGRRLIAREVVTHAEMGVIADQFYAERLYTYEEISKQLSTLGYRDIQLLSSVASDSSRGQDLGMMAHRLLITAQGPTKLPRKKSAPDARTVTVIMGDPKLPDSVKKDGCFNAEDFHTINRLKDALKPIPGYRFHYLDKHKTLLKQLMQEPPRFVFNLCDEGFHNQAAMELHIPAVLELLGVPYSGAGPACLALCYDKSKVRAIASDMDIPVPMEAYLDPHNQSAHIPSTFPALLKPAQGDSSIGITQQALVHNARELVEYIDYLRGLTPGVPVLVQEFLAGREFSVGLIGNPDNFNVLPILEVDYSALPPQLPPILSYESKWLPDSPYWTDIRYHEANIDDDFRQCLVAYSQALFERLDCRDYARFDFRCDAEGTAKLLEVNPNPGWCWDGKLNLMASWQGKTYSELLAMVLNVAFERVTRNAEIAANGNNLLN